MSTGYSSGFLTPQYQAAWSSLSVDSTINDNDTTTGPDMTNSPPAQITGGLDLGSVMSVAGVSFTIGYWWNLTMVLEYSSNSTSWTSIPFTTPGSNGGTFALYSATVSASVTARYIRLSVSDDGDFLTANGHISIREIGVAGPEIITYALAYQTTGTQDPAPYFATSSGIATGGPGNTGVSIYFDFGAATTIEGITGVVGFANTSTEIWEKSSDGITWSTVTTTLSTTYGSGLGGVYTEYDQLWTISGGPISTRYLRYSIKDTAPGSSLAQAAVVSIAPQTPATGTGGGGLTLTGTLLRNISPVGRIDNSPWANCEISFCWKKWTGYHVGYCLLQNPDFNGYYCADGKWEHATVTTDCDGNWTWTTGDDVIRLRVALGPVRLNPNFDPEIPFFDGMGGVNLDADGIPYGWYLIPDVSVPQWAGAQNLVLGITPDVQGLDVNATGTLTSFTSFGATGFTDATVRSGGTCCGPGMGSGGAQQVAVPILYEVVAGEQSCGVIDLISGSYTLNLKVGGQPNIQFIMKAYGNYYNLGLTDPILAPWSATLHDSCGHTPGTISGALGEYPMPTTLDWWTISSVTGVTVSPNVNCTNVYNYPGVYPTTIEGKTEIYPSNQLGTDVGRWGVNFDPVSLHNVYILVDCVNTVHPVICADAWDGVMNVAWTNAAGALKTAAHLGPSKYITMGDMGWETTQTIETANVTQVGLVYLANGRLYLGYRSNGTAVYRTSDRRGLVSGWTASAFGAGGNAPTEFPEGGRGFLIAFACSDAGQITVCQENRGSIWIPQMGPADFQNACCAFMEHSYCILGTTSAGAILAQTSPDLVTWAVSAGSIGINGTVLGLVRLAFGRLVGLIKVSTSYYTLVSDDRGVTWTQSAAISLPSSVDTGLVPRIVIVNETLYVIYIHSDAPVFVASVDSGVTWI